MKADLFQVYTQIRYPDMEVIVDKFPIQINKLIKAIDSADIYIANELVKTMSEELKELQGKINKEIAIMEEVYK